MYVFVYIIPIYVNGWWKYSIHLDNFDVVVLHMRGFDTRTPFTKTIHLNNEVVITYIIKCGMKLLIHSQISTVQPLKFGGG